MKKLLLALLLSISLLSTAQEFKTPVDYLTYINKEQGIISRSTWKYTSAVAHSKSARRIDNTRKQLIKTIQTTKKKIGDIKNGYNGDVEYQNQVIQYFDFCEKNLNEEYDKIINMQEVAEQSYDAMEAYLLARDLVNEKLDSENEKAIATFNAFALKYNIKIGEGDTELSKKIKISNEVFDYHTVLYLIFFKVNFTDASLAKAVQKKDMAAIEQNANALLQYANEGLEKIKTIAPYNKDASLITATTKVLEYYKKEAETHVPKIVSFYMFNDKFENTKKTIESKSQKDRTKEEIDNYNDMVKQVNKEIDTYNKANNLDFQDKQNAVNNWNTVAENFISKHVPVD